MNIVAMVMISVSAVAAVSKNGGDNESDDLHQSNDNCHHWLSSNNIGNGYSKHPTGQVGKI